MIDEPTSGLDVEAIRMRLRLMLDFDFDELSDTDAAIMAVSFLRGDLAGHSAADDINTLLDAVTRKGNRLFEITLENVVLRDEVIRLRRLETAIVEMETLHGSTGDCSSDKCSIGVVLEMIRWKSE